MPIGSDGTFSRLSIHYRTGPEKLTLWLNHLIFHKSYKELMLNIMWYRRGEKTKNQTLIKDSNLRRGCSTICFYHGFDVVFTRLVRGPNHGTRCHVPESHLHAKNSILLESLGGYVLRYWHMAL